MGVTKTRTIRELRERIAELEAENARLKLRELFRKIEYETWKAYYNESDVRKPDAPYDASGPIKFSIDLSEHYRKAKSEFLESLNSMEEKAREDALIGLGWTPPPKPVVHFETGMMAIDPSICGLKGAFDIRDQTWVGTPLWDKVTCPECLKHKPKPAKPKVRRFTVEEANTIHTDRLFSLVNGFLVLHPCDREMNPIMDRVYGCDDCYHTADELDWGKE